MVGLLGNHILFFKLWKNLKEGDKVFLLDTLDIFHPDIFDFVDEVMGDDVCLYHWKF